MFHYTYIIINTTTKKKYIGVRSCKCKPVDDVTYWGSSRVLLDDIKNKGKMCFKKRVLCVFLSRKEALTHEILLHDRYNVAVSEIFYNMSKQTCTGFDVTGTKLIRVLTSEMRQKMSKARKGKKHSNESIKKMSQSTLGFKHSASTKKKIGNASKLRKHTHESKRKMSLIALGRKKSDNAKKNMAIAQKGKCWYNNGTITKRCVKGTEPENFVPGRIIK
jgi:hypothetical protein